MSQVIAGVLLLTGATLTLLAAVGVLRMPDVYVRMQASTKAATVGILSMMGGVAFHFGDVGTAMTALLVSVFFLLTAPVAAHVIGRAAYVARVPLWGGTKIDELGENPERS